MSSLTDEQWGLLEPLVSMATKRDRRFSGDIRRVVDGILYVSHSGCQRRCLPAEFGPWTSRVPGPEAEQGQTR